MDDRFAAYRAAGDELLASGGFFELTEEDVLGVPMQVFASRTRSLGELIERSAAHGDAEFLIFDGGPRISFTENHELVRRAAIWLRTECGVGTGDRVAICGANCPEWVIAALGTMAMGAVVVALNSWWSAEELARALASTEPIVVLADAKRRALLADPGCAVVPLEDLFGELALATPDVRLDQALASEDDPAMLMFTSGTSGAPKAAVLTHRCLLGFVHLGAFMGARSAKMGEPSPSDAPRLAVFPLFHVSGISPLMSSLAFGRTTVWPVGRFDPERVIRMTIAEGIGSWTGAATHISRLLDHPAIEELDVDQIRQVGVGGSATTPTMVARIEERFPHLEATASSGYGLTESGALVSYASAAMLAVAPDCVGLPLPTVEVKIVDESFAEVPEGEVGSVCVRSPIVMPGYWRNPEADAGAFLPGRWLRTEDFGRLEGGLLYIASRRRDLIIRGGENVYPAETEECLAAHPDVDEVAVFGVEDRDLGQAVHAAVVLRPGSVVSAEELRQHCAQRLAYFKVPDQVTIRDDALPRNATGKVPKHVLERDPLATIATDPG